MNLFISKRFFNGRKDFNEEVTYHTCHPFKQKFQDDGLSYVFLKNGKICVIITITTENKAVIIMNHLSRQKKFECEWNRNGEVFTFTKDGSIILSIQMEYFF